ncbi:probable inactive ATP-dependent zinc metalloprotease FTSHI 3, chloroplastic [Cryptomeria japonica]|uniref:probable inactive ATP-dependent zinc metalloprotease FTSHI 3, chloroplastic n=1 Tax=Cryptomeria japonica TaxID=3369 RepID=UPI0027DA189D|nr:probable inactive ATP-dependent zinc metalloprotease FTSHI 3, chloroplastic [Cryptomeria japonica]XP_057842441.2 probable inactive ATP-dependent zinc metalloprotease FTSHI 3, chloroplastic [Cryptomeria japonica]XP_057842442.2 probable inactive ATP-dependent zinc metalloprotease FTSHI 3, chloroplastic [Cryptomeria japonica]
MAQCPALAIPCLVPSSNKKMWSGFPDCFQASPKDNTLKCKQIRKNLYIKSKRNLLLSPLPKVKVVKALALQGSRTFQYSWLFAHDREHSCLALKTSTPRKELQVTELRYKLRIQCNYEKQNGKGNALGKSSVPDQENLPSNKKKHQHPKESLFFILQGRARMLLQNLRKCSPHAIIKALMVFLRQYSRQVAISTAVGSVLGFCCLGLKLTAVPSSEIAPYSDLVRSLQAGRVTNVLFEEGSRRIFFNTHCHIQDKLQSIEKLADNTESNMTAVSGTKFEDARNDLETHVARDGGNLAGETNKFLLEEQNRKRSDLSSKITQMNNRTWQYATRRVEHDESYLLSLMREHGTIYSSAPQPLSASLRSILITVMSLWIPLTPMIWILLRQISPNTSSAKKRRSSKQMVKFEDVAGVDAAKAELMEIVSCLQGNIKFSTLGAKLSKGVLLIGPPGTGKTLLARAVAGEAEVPFFATSASEFVELFVGRGAARIRDLFNVARKCAPSIIFIDELDAVGGRRGRSFNDERDQTLNQLLTEMDGFESDTGVLVIAATNRPEALDPALCRPGRFSRRVFVREPDVDGRRKILAIYLRGIPLEEDPEMVCNLVASITSGFVGADLANVVNEAALLAARQGNTVVTVADLREAVNRAKYGIGDKVALPAVIEKELGRLFPWIPSRAQTTINDNNDTQPLGYQSIT